MEQFANSPAKEINGSDMDTTLLVSDDDLKRFVEISPFPAFVIDQDCNFISVNATAYKFLGYAPGDLKASKLTKIARSQESWSLPDAVHRFLHGPEKWADWEFLRRDQHWVWGEVTAQSLPGERWLVFVYDIADRQRVAAALLASEERRWQSKKIEALERLAGGIAHDFNNLLAVILLQTEMLNLQLTADNPLVRRVDEIKAVASDAAAIVRQLLAFGRKQPMNPAPVVLNEVVEGFCGNIAAYVGDNIHPVLDLDPALGICFVDRQQIAQALVFLAVNAKDAMPDGGNLRIESTNIMVDKLNSHKSQPGGPYIQIAVSDNGIGMNPQTEDHIFEPFFSTKESDKGAGLSLASVYGIVKQSGGFIWVESEVGRGTSFKIQFPRIDPPNRDVQPLRTGELSLTGDETILLVDDDRSVRRIAAEILTISGYNVIEAASGMAALEIAQGYREPIHLLLSDYSMPKMNGSATAEGVRKLHPEITVMFMSGEILSLADAHERVHFLGKPFSSSSLTLKVREALRTT